MRLYPIPSQLGWHIRPSLQKIIGLGLKRIAPTRGSRPWLTGSSAAGTCCIRFPSTLVYICSRSPSTQTDNLHTLVITVMNIYLTNHADVRHTKFCTADGQTLYKSETPGWFHAGKKTTIYKVIPNDDPEDMSTLSQFCPIYCRLIKSTHSILS
jgi:hypothetical protein